MREIYTFYIVGDREKMICVRRGNKFAGLGKIPLRTHRKMSITEYYLFLTRIYCNANDWEKSTDDICKRYDL